MAKKAQVIQLQTEVNNDEEWEKLLQKDGLIVVDIYSEWCGPCTGMTATLKKLKLEIGGDLLQLAIAKADKITALERFRNKSEPSWMFISKGKMVNFMFGANAPKLTRLIIEELKKENEAREGKRDRVQMDISELAEDEKVRNEVIEKQQRLAEEKERAKAAKDLYERRLAECHHILENLHQFGVILVFPHARTTYHDAFGDLLGEAGLTITQTEKITVLEQQLAELFFFSQNPFPEDAMEELLTEQSLVLLIKPIPARDVTEPTDELLLQVVYGESKKPPGDKDSPARHLEKKAEETEGEPAEVIERVGIWVPEIDLEKAVALRLFFPGRTEQFLIPEPEPEPPHYAVVFNSHRRHELKDLMEKYKDEILRYGFFTSEVPEEARLICKTPKQYEKHLARLPFPEEKLVIQLSKKKSECVLAFVSMKPQYISPNAIEGKRECKIFFPEDYDEPPPEEEEEEEEEDEKEKKKKKKDKDRGDKAKTATDETTVEPDEMEKQDEEKTEAEDATVEEDFQLVPPSQKPSTDLLTGVSSAGAVAIEGGTEAPPPPLPPPPIEEETPEPAQPEEKDEEVQELAPESPVTAVEEPTATEPTTTEPTTDVTETTDEESPA